jgi:hypothetical protein
VRTGTSEDVNMFLSDTLDVPGLRRRKIEARRKDVYLMNEIVQLPF